MKNKIFEFTLIPLEGLQADLTEFNRYLHKDEIVLVKNATIKRKKEFLAGRLAAKTAYCLLVKNGKSMDFQDICIHNDCLGAPYLGDSRYFSSISHDNEYAAAVVSDRQEIKIGVDIQRSDMVNEQIKSYFLNKKEIQLLDKYQYLFAENILYTAFWVAKESMSKLLQYGFSSYGLLEIEHLEIENDLIINFKGLSSFQVIIRLFHGYVLGFAAFKKKIGLLNKDNLEIKESKLV